MILALLLFPSDSRPNDDGGRNPIMLCSENEQNVRSQMRIEDRYMPRVHRQARIGGSVYGR